MNGLFIDMNTSNKPQPTKPILDLYLVRHGTSEANMKRHIIGGRASKSPLHETGIIQANTLANYLIANGIKFDKIFCSTATRAVDTALIVANRVQKDQINIDPYSGRGDKVNVEAYKELEELDQGKWEGRLRDEMYTPHVLDSVKRNILDFKAPDGESQREVGNRIDKFITQHVLTNNPPMKIAIFFHGLAIKCWLQHIMQFDPKFLYPMEIDNCSVTRLKYNCKTKLWGLKCINSMFTEMGE